MFDYAIKRHLVRFDPAAAFDLADAGGKGLARERALSSDELVTLFAAMRQAKGFCVQNELTVKRLLLLSVRKGELVAARWDEFELEADASVWHLPGIGKLKGVEGVYNRHDDFEERRRALEGWGQLLLKLERQGPLPKKPAAARQPATTAEEA